jgi:hypothetical protein
VNARLKYFFGGLLITAAISGVVSALIGLGFWLVFPITVAALLINGLVAEWEDDQPGGFNNP